MKGSPSSALSSEPSMVMLTLRSLVFVAWSWEPEMKTSDLALFLFSGTYFSMPSSSSSFCSLLSVAVSSMVSAYVAVILTVSSVVFMFLAVSLLVLGASETESSRLVSVRLMVLLLAV